MSTHKREIEIFFSDTDKKIPTCSFCRKEKQPIDVIFFDTGTTIGRFYPDAEEKDTPLKTMACYECASSILKQAFRNIVITEGFNINILQDDDH